MRIYHLGLQCLNISNYSMLCNRHYFSGMWNFQNINPTSIINFDKTTQYIVHWENASPGQIQTFSDISCAFFPQFFPPFLSAVISTVSLKDNLTAGIYTIYKLTLLGLCLFQSNEHFSSFLFNSNQLSVYINCSLIIAVCEVLLFCLHF